MRWKHFIAVKVVKYLGRRKSERSSPGLLDSTEKQYLVQWAPTNIVRPGDKRNIYDFSLYTRFLLLILFWTFLELKNVKILLCKHSRDGSRLVFIVGLIEKLDIALVKD